MRRWKIKRSNKGIAVTELAIVLPVFVLFAIVPLELCTMIHLRHSLSVASYETAKIAIRKQGSYAVATAQFDQIVQDRNIQGATVAFSVVEANLNAGDKLTVTCQAPFAANALLGDWYTDKSPAVSITMIKE
jgi:Flp pilus assembly protein TadG